MRKEGKKKGKIKDKIKSKVKGRKSKSYVYWTVHHCDS